MQLNRVPDEARRPVVASSSTVAIRLLGAFEVSIDDEVVAANRWKRRTAAALVKILALTPGHRLHREQVMDLLWPDERPSDAAPKLHKAAHYARRACGDGGVVLRNDIVILFPDVDVVVDVAVFDELSRQAITDADPVAARAAIARYAGELLPDDRYDEWASDRRELLRLRHLNLLRITRQWFEVTELEPGDEDAHVELMRHSLAVGDGNAALLQYERMERVLESRIGIAPGPAVRELRGDILAAIAAAERVIPEPPPAVEALVAELAALARRQAAVLDALAAHRVSPPVLGRVAG
jgi:DNA-binding SARP family transcriptional activator